MNKQIIKAIFKGLFFSFPFTYLMINAAKNSKHSCSNSDFAFNLWQRMTEFLKKNKIDYSNFNIAEIGSGGSLALGYCFLLSGAKSYSALEMDAKFNLEDNLNLLEQVLEIFQSLPSYNATNFQNINLPELSSNISIKLSKTDFQEKSEIIRNDLRMISIGKPEQCTIIKFLTKWENQQSLSCKYDLVLSRAVMEHVRKPNEIYRRIFEILKEHGIQLHDIEFHSHGLTPEWDGHFYINSLLWKLIFGRRPYYLNRLRFEQHIQLLEQTGNRHIDFFSTLKQPKNIGDNIYGASLLFKKL